MFSIKVDREKNRIYAKLGTIETGEGEQIFEQIKSQLNLLTPGFTGISDITEFKVNDPQEAVWVDKIFMLLKEAEIGLSARVTGLKTKTKQVTGRHGQPVFIVKTLAEADQLLDDAQSKLHNNCFNPENNQHLT